MLTGEGGGDEGPPHRTEPSACGIQCNLHAGSAGMELNSRSPAGDPELLGTVGEGGPHPRAGIGSRNSKRLMNSHTQHSGTVRNGIKEPL